MLITTRGRTAVEHRDQYGESDVAFEAVLGDE
jgi:hypothetical protein